MPAKSKAPVNKNNAPKKKPEERGLVLSALKNFGIIFLVSLLIFGIVASFAVTLITSTVDDILKDEKNELDSILNKEDGEQVSNDGEDFELPDGESFTSLFVVTDYDVDNLTYYPKDGDLKKLKSKADSREMGILGAGYHTVKARYIVLIRADKESREYTITPLASCTRVYTPLGYKLLGDVYDMFGPEYFVQKVSALTGIGIDYYYFMNITEAQGFIKAVGSFSVDLATDIYSDGVYYGTADGAFNQLPQALPPEEFTETTEETETEEPETEQETEEDEEEDEDTSYKVVARAGTVTVNASNIQALLMFENYKNGVSERNDLQYQIAKGILLNLSSLNQNEMLSLFAKTCVQTDYDSFDEDIFNDSAVNTNMNAQTLSKKTALIAACQKFDITSLDFPGKFVTDYFVPSLTDGTSKMAEYKLPADPEKE